LGGKINCGKRLEEARIMCMGMGYGFPLPAGAGVIADLEAGDEIKIKKGFGSPRVEEDTIDIVVDVHQFSALTASGIKLMCGDGHGVEPTDRHFEEGEYEISEKAKAILEEVRLQMGLEELGEAGLIKETRPN
jgi:hypothetical protein